MVVALVKLLLFGLAFTCVGILALSSNDSQSLSAKSSTNPCCLSFLSTVLDKSVAPTFQTSSKPSFREVAVFVRAALQARSSSGTNPPSTQWFVFSKLAAWVLESSGKAPGLVGGMYPFELVGRPLRMRGKSSTDMSRVLMP
jgi:hypothetical protein